MPAVKTKPGPQQAELFPAQRRVYTVSELTQEIKSLLSAGFAQVWVEGEVSGASRSPTGTLFFSIKDEASILKCVIFASQAGSLKFELKDGVKVIACGHVSVYEKRGEYQLYVQQLEPKGLGSLQLALEQLKKRLEKEGLFSSQRKRLIPFLPRKIGVVTSLSGAAVRDILKVVERRFSDVQIVISPAQVQGEGAKDDIARAIAELNAFSDTFPPGEKIEVMIVGRGGGSIEDLWAFNEEVVARAIYHSRVPVISAVGHERDWTVADLVADMRAATPSVAAELVLPEKAQLKEKLRQLQDKLGAETSEKIFNLREELEDMAHRLGLAISGAARIYGSRWEALQKKLALLNPALLLSRHKERALDLMRQIGVGLRHLMAVREKEFSAAADKLSALSPLNILSRGYSIAFKLPSGEVVKEAGQLREGDLIKTRLRRGEVFSRVEKRGENGGDQI